MPSSKKPSPSEAPPNFGLPSMDDLRQMAERFKLPGVDVGALVEWQRKDLEALTEAHRQAFDGMKAVVERRNEILRDSFQQWQENLKGAAGLGPDAIRQQTEAAQAGMQQAMENFRELSAMEADARNKAWKVLQDRMQENMASLQKVFQAK